MSTGYMLIQYNSQILDRLFLSESETSKTTNIWSEKL